MLIEFLVANYKSIKEEARLSMVAGTGKEHWATHLFSPPLAVKSRPIYLVGSAAIFGANAAGKSNLIDALATMKYIVLKSNQGLETIPTVPFKFDPEFENQGTTFEVKCIVSGVRYQYGFKVFNDDVIEEWLFAWPLGRVQHWFERDGLDWNFGDKLVGDKEVWRRATRPNALFLSTAVSLNSKQLEPLYNWFRETLQLIGPTGLTNRFSIECCKEDKKEEIIEFLRSADLAISDIQIEEENFDPETLPADMPLSLKEELIRDLHGRTLVNLHFQHETGHGRPTNLDLEEESEGTQKIFALAGPWLDALHSGNVVVVDELDNSLHPALVAFLVERFHDPEVNTKGAQLIFTTHDATILSQKSFRRDQIWFCERNSYQETQLYPLSDFKPRKDLENLERSYLSGRFGALPYLQPTATSILL